MPINDNLTTRVPVTVCFSPKQRTLAIVDFYPREQFEANIAQHRNDITEAEIRHVCENYVGSRPRTVTMDEDSWREICRYISDERMMVCFLINQ